MLRKVFNLFSNMSVECRHGVYVWWLTGACLSGIMLLSLCRTGSVAEHGVDILGWILMTVVCAYLGIEMVGRSQVLNKIGDRAVEGRKDGDGDGEHKDN